MSSIKDLPSRPVTASRVSCVSSYPCAIQSYLEPVRLLCKSQNSPAESTRVPLLLLVGLGSLHSSHKAFDLHQSRLSLRSCRLGGNIPAIAEVPDTFPPFSPPPSPIDTIPTHDKLSLDSSLSLPLLTRTLLSTQPTILLRATTLPGSLESLCLFGIFRAGIPLVTDFHKGPSTAHVLLEGLISALRHLGSVTGPVLFFSSSSLLFILLSSFSHQHVSVLQAAAFNCFANFLAHACTNSLDGFLFSLKWRWLGSES